MLLNVPVTNAKPASVTMRDTVLYSSRSDQSHLRNAALFPQMPFGAFV